MFNRSPKLVSQLYPHPDYPGLVLPRTVEGKPFTKKQVQQAGKAYLETVTYCRATIGAANKKDEVTATLIGAFQKPTLTKWSLNRVWEVETTFEMFKTLFETQILWSNNVLEVLLENAANEIEWHWSRAIDDGLAAAGNYSGWSAENFHIISNFHHPTFDTAFAENTRIPEQLKIMRPLLSLTSEWGQNG